MNKIREYREKAGISQNRLAQKCRMHPSHLSLIAGGGPTTKRTARKLARVLNVDPTELFPNFAELREC